MRHRSVREILAGAIGLDVKSLGKSNLERALERRMHALGIPDEETYASLVASSREELSRLTEEVVIPETWFFRDKEPFDALVRFSCRWAGKNPGRILRLLSIPCSTGEEPYSMAISLLEAGWPLERFSIDAADVSKRALAHAKRGLYTRHAFREEQVEIKQKYFQEQERGFLLAEDIRKNIRFFQENIVSPTFLKGNRIYDVIFCRNLLIYLTKEASERAILTLEGLLKDDGILFVGHAETGRIPPERFVPAQYPRSFAFLKRSHCSREVAVPGPSPCTFLPPKPPPVIPPPRPRPSRGKKRKEGRRADLEEARRLADQGDLERARAMCELYIHQNGHSAQAYFLLGVVCNASGDQARASEALQKAIYLQPDHYEALVLLSLIAERSGERARAESLRRRASRQGRKRLEGHDTGDLP